LTSLSASSLCSRRTEV